jgi:hypothetical protein
MMNEVYLSKDEERSNQRVSLDGQLVTGCTVKIQEHRLQRLPLTTGYNDLHSIVYFAITPNGEYWSMTVGILCESTPWKKLF